MFDVQYCIFYFNENIAAEIDMHVHEPEKPGGFCNCSCIVSILVSSEVA